jgi:hypothetical protein
LNPAYYTIFGLALRSNFSIPSLKAVAASSTAHDLEVRFEDEPCLDCETAHAIKTLIFASSVKSDSGEPAFRIWRISDPPLIHLEYQDGMNFWIDRDGKNVWAKWPDALTLADATSYLLGPVLGLLLRLRGITCLHASAVVLDNHAGVFAGGDGAGKSTTAAAFAARGYAVLSDDVVALVERDNAFYVMPAYPYISLWSDSVEMLYGPEKTLPSFSHNFDKRRLALEENDIRFEQKPLPLGAVFILGPRTSDAAAPYVERLTRQEALMSLVANSYAAHLVDDDVRGSEFAFLGRVVSSVPVVRLRPHTDPTRLGRLCDVVRDVRPSPHTDPAR